MHDLLQARLAILKREFETGQARLKEIEREEVYLRETLLRISGAMQVLDELLAEAVSGKENGPHLEAAEPSSKATSHPILANK